MIEKSFELSPGSVISLYQIDFTNALAFTPSVNPILYLCSYRDGNNNLTYDGHVYDFIGIIGTGFRSEINGVIPKPTLSIDKTSLYNNAQYKTLKQEYIEQTGEMYFDWRGSQVTRLQTINLDTSRQTVVQTFIVEQVNKITKDELEIQLAVSLGIDKLRDQSIQTLGANRCSLRYRSYNAARDDFDYVDVNANGCPWNNPTSTTDWSAVGDNRNKYFTSEDIETPQKRFDQCSYGVGGCQIRFDPNKVGLILPFKGKYNPKAGT